MIKLTDEAKDKIKAELLQTGEAVSKEAAEFVFTLIDIVIKDTETKIDDIVLGVMPQIKTYVMDLLDGISKEA